MTQPTYTKQTLAPVKLPELKKIALELGVTPAGKKTEREVWIDAIVEHQASQVEKIADAVVEQPIAPVNAISAWDFTPPEYNSPAVICPDCGGRGCGNCNYRGTRGIDLCTPADEYRLMYAAKTDSQIAYNAYIGDKFLGIVFKVRNLGEVWENTQQTYYWECGVTGNFWSVKDTVEALQKRNTPDVAETPVSKEQDAIREQRAKSVEVVSQEGDEYIVHNCSNNNYYVVRPNHLDSHQRCECADSYYRGVKCKHQYAVENFTKVQRLENLISINPIELLLNKPFDELTIDDWALLKEYEPQSSEEFVAA